MIYNNTMLFIQQNVIHTTEYYSALERKKILIHGTTQMNLADV